MQIQEFIFATSNSNKVKEVNQLLGSSVQVKSLKDIGFTTELPETQDTIKGNAIQKAETLFQHIGKPCFAEDTGLIVPALNGAPGVYSARYAGPQKNDQDNMNLLLHNLQQQSDRSAHFKTVIALRTAEQLFTFEGIAQGQIITSPRGNHGFGYDPIFLPHGYNTTFAEMDMQAKSKISHRAKALNKLIEYLAKT